MVERRCAMTIDVLPRSRFLIASWISCSVSVSTLDVASSRTRILRIECQRPRERKQLLLADGERRTAFFHFRIVLMRQAFNELVRSDDGGGVLDLLDRQAIFAERNIGLDVAGEQEHILQHHGDMFSQLFRGYVKNIDAVDENFAFLDVVEPAQQADDGCFPRSGVADDGDCFTGTDTERNVLQNPFRRMIAVGRGVVGKPHVAEFDLAFHIGHAAAEIHWCAGTICRRAAGKFFPTRPSPSAECCIFPTNRGSAARTFR